MSGPFERRANDGIIKYGEKAMEGDKGSSESSSLLTESQSTNKKYDIKYEVMMTQNDDIKYEVMRSNSYLAYNISSLFGRLLGA